MPRSRRSATRAWTCGSWPRTAERPRHAPKRSTAPPVGTARRSTGALGSATGSLLVGGVDPEAADPRLDAAALARIARASGGAVITARELPSLLERLRTSTPAVAAMH